MSNINEAKEKKIDVLNVSLWQHVILKILYTLIFFFLSGTSCPRDNWGGGAGGYFNFKTIQTKLNKILYLECFLTYLNDFIQSHIILKILINEVSALKNYNVRILNRLNDSENLFYSMTTF